MSPKETFKHLRINSYSPMQRTDFVNTRGPGGFYSTTAKKKSAFGYDFSGDMAETGMTGGSI